MSDMLTTLVSFNNADGATPVGGTSSNGTRIQTARGNLPIETLRIGDLVAVESGCTLPIRWIGRRGYAGRFLARNRHLHPVCLREGALADGVPSRDLFVSPLHAMFIDGVLVAAVDLVNGVTIVQPEPPQSVSYFHIELRHNNILLAEGAPSESFVDDDSRMMFHNAPEYAALYPGEPRVPALYCAPRVTGGYALEAIRQRLGERAGTRAPRAAVPLRGFVDRVGRTRIEGWAQDPERPEVPVCLDVLIDDVVVGQVLANRYRADLAAGGLGSGRHGFSFLRADTGRGVVTVRRSSDGAKLPRSRTGPGCGVSVRARTEGRRSEAHPRMLGSPGGPMKP